MRRRSLSECSTVWKSSMLPALASVFTNNDELKERRCRLLHVSPKGGSITTWSGTAIGDTLPLERCSAIDTLIVAGGSRLALIELTAGTTPSRLRAQALRAPGMASGCTGAFLLGRQACSAAGARPHTEAPQIIFSSFFRRRGWSIANASRRSGSISRSPEAKPRRRSNGFCREASPDRARHRRP